MSFPLPQFLQFYPTFRCNQNCSFCFNDPSGHVRDMSPEHALQLLDIMGNLSIRDLDIMGGEPFLLPWMPSFLYAAIKEDIMVNISTNGSMPEIMEEFRGLTPTKINIGFSLEGSTAEKHNALTNSVNFEKALSSISSLVSIGLDPIVKTVVSRTTMQDIPSITELLKKLGVKRYYLIHMDMFSRAVNNKPSAISYPAFMSFFHEISARASGDMQIFKVNASCFERQTLPDGVRCAGGVKKLSVMPDGSVYPCNLFQQFQEFRLGNIFSDSLDQIWNHPKLGVFRSFKKNQCALTACGNHTTCTGGCPAHSRFHSYDMNSTDIRCRRPVSLP